MKHVFVLIGFLLYAPVLPAQILKGLGEKVERSVKRRVEQKTNRAIEKGLDQVEDEIEGIGKRDSVHHTDAGKQDRAGVEGAMAPDVGFYTKFDFVPGNTILFFDDFSADRPGDFPSGWNTNGTGEVVVAENHKENYFWLKGGALYIPVLPDPLPEDYTIEFDLKIKGLNEKISSTSYLDILLDESPTFEPGSKRAVASISFCQYISNGLDLFSMGGAMGTIENTITEDYRKALLNDPHISIAVNRGRFRLWVDAMKLVDVPRFLPAGARYLKLNLRGFSTDFKQMQVLIDRFKIASGGVDLREQLIDQGKWTTTGILFETGSAQVRPESYGVLKKIAGILQQNPGVRIRVVGHTDSEGEAAFNLQLSEKRAERVKNILVKTFNLAADRLQSEGKGASEPVADNQSVAGKARNRRVDFIKL